MATYKLKRKNFGLFSPFAKTAANWTAAKELLKQEKMPKVLRI